MKRGDFIWTGALIILLSPLAIPTTHHAILAATRAHPLVMGFVKFAILASLGELLGLRMRLGEWKTPVGMAWRVIVWGILGAVIALMFQVYSAGVQGAMNAGMLPGKGSMLQTIATAFWISTVMNTTFGPAMMAAHRVADTYIELCGGHIFRGGTSGTDVIAHTNWQTFFGFVIAKTIPFVWIPAHALTFLAPPEYRVLIAAMLSVLFGGILGFAARSGGAKPAGPGPQLEDVAVSR